MTKKQRIEELERRVRELEARPIQYQPIYVPAAPMPPQVVPWNQPIYMGDLPPWGTTTCELTTTPNNGTHYYKYPGGAIGSTKTQ